MSHYEMPIELTKKYNGWISRELVPLFEKYARVILERYKNKVKYWITFNEMNMNLNSLYTGAGILEDLVDDSLQASEKMTNTPVETKYPIEVYSPMKGEVRDLATVTDETFSTGLMGKGVAIFPEEGVVYAPFSGKITMMTPTKHAVGIRSEEGVDLLIHVGIDTVKLQGESFDYLVAADETVEKGQPIIRFDLEKIARSGYDLTTMIIVTNSSEFLDVIITGDRQVESTTSRLMMCIQ
jgi:beta-glucoside PTS system EIICBA component